MVRLEPAIEPTHRGSPRIDVVGPDAKHDKHEPRRNLVDVIRRGSFFTRRWHHPRAQILENFPPQLTVL
jgi:hypothetical protein